MQMLSSRCLIFIILSIYANFYVLGFQRNIFGRIKQSKNGVYHQTTLFSSPLHKQHEGSADKSTRSAIQNMIRNSKKKEIVRINAELEESKLDSDSNSDKDGEFNSAVVRLKNWLQHKELDIYLGGKHQDFYTHVVDRYDTLNVIPQYDKKSKTGFLLGIPGPEIMGGVLRDGGARSIVVCMDPTSGGVTADEFARFARDQQRARTMIPGPIPIIWHDFIIDNIQISRAAANGAAAITIYPDLLNGDKNSIKELILFCNENNMEPIVMCSDKKSVDVAIETGGRFVVLHNLNNQEMIALRNEYPRIHRNREYADLVWGARLGRTTEFSSIEEIDAAWELRDSGFHFAWPTMDAMYSMGMEDVYSTINAMMSKAGQKYISPRQFLMERKKEGAKEFLGELSI